MIQHLLIEQFISIKLIKEFFSEYFLNYFR